MARPVNPNIPIAGLLDRVKGHILIALILAAALRKVSRKAKKPDQKKRKIKPVKSKKKKTIEDVIARVRVSKKTKKIVPPLLAKPDGIEVEEKELPLEPARTKGKAEDAEAEPETGERDIESLEKLEEEEYEEEEERDFDDDEDAEDNLDDGERDDYDDFDEDKEEKNEDDYFKEDGDDDGGDEGSFDDDKSAR